MIPESKELVALLQWDAELPGTTPWLQASAVAGQMLSHRLNCAKCACGRDKWPPRRQPLCSEVRSLEQGLC